MNTILKDRVKGVKENIRECEYQYDLAKEKVQLQQNLLLVLKNNPLQILVRRKEEIITLEGEIDSIMVNVSDNLDISASYEKSLEAYGDVETELNELKIYESGLRTKEKHLIKSISSLRTMIVVLPVNKQLLKTLEVLRKLRSLHS